MESLLLFGIFFVGVFLSIPIGIAIGVAIIAYVFITGNIDFTYIIGGMFTACDSFPLIAIPFFILSGTLMEGGGLSKRLVNFFDSLVGQFAGGLSIVTVVACLFFGAISGSGPATVAAIGTIMVPTMIEKGYDKKFAMALVAAAGCLGVIIPPSIPMVMYGVSANASISTLFSAGFLPGILCGLALIIISIILCKKLGYKGNGLKFSIRRVGTRFKEAIWALLVPVIILGGIYGGFFTPTEAAVIAVVYAFIIGFFVYKELTPSVCYSKFADAAKTTGSTIIIVATGTILGRVLTMEGVPQSVAEGLLGISENKIVVLLLLNGLLLTCGRVLETTSGILILAPILYRIAGSVGVDIIHFGIIMVVNLAIGFITPPVGVNLFVSCAIGNVRFEQLVKSIIPFLIALLVGLMVITFWPDMVLFIPRLMGYAG